jgi:hypothetical protein
MDGKSKNHSYYLDCWDEWNHIHPNDLWTYNKLFLSRKLGYVSGPAGCSVPEPNFYIVRPSFNILGMSRFARIEWIDDNTEHLHPAEFWCEIFEGQHLSVDFYQGVSKLVVVGEKSDDHSLYKWKKWYKIEKHIEFPKILHNLCGDYDWINCEFINGNLIEIQYRRNPDFRYNNSVAIPIWDEKEIKNYQGYRFIEDKDYKRIGFLVK